jgi:hypothetical protein
MTNLGEIVIRQAIRELTDEGVLRSRIERDGLDLVALTGRRPEWRAPKLRDVCEKMRSAMGIRGARPYLMERHWDL